MELLALWLDDLAIALGCRLLLLLVAGCALYIKHRKQRYGHSMRITLRLLFLEDLSLAVLSGRVFFSLYTLGLVYTPGVALLLLESSLDYVTVMDCTVHTVEQVQAQMEKMEAVVMRRFQSEESGSIV